MSEAGLGPATELEMELSPRAEFRAQSVHSHMPRQKGEKEQAMDQSQLEPGRQGFMAM